MNFSDTAQYSLIRFRIGCALPKCRPFEKHYAFGPATLAEPGDLSNRCCACPELTVAATAEQGMR
jgi:hypothetical protein